MLEDYLSEKQRKKKMLRRKLWWAFGILTVFFAALLVAWFITESPVFRVDRITVTGNYAVASSDVITLLQASVGLHPTFFSRMLGMGNMLTWPKALRASDVALVPQLASVSIQKNYGDHTLTATVHERAPLAIWCEMPRTDAYGNPSGDETCFWFDDTGTLFQKAFDTEGSEIFAVHDYSQTGLGIDGKILPDLFVQNMLSILGAIKASGLTPEEIALHDIGLEEVDVSTYGGPMIYFSLRFNAMEDLPVLQQLLAKPNFNSLQYIDFRTENRAYYK
jgi:hypothetical protein